MTKSRGERGEGGIKAILFLAVLAYGVFCGVKIVPAMSDDGSIVKKVQELLKFAATNNIKTDKDLRYQIESAVKTYSIPVKPEDIEISDEGSQWRVKFKYSRNIKLLFYTYKKDHSINEVANK